jgi:hypothetical protein
MALQAWVAAVSDDYDAALNFAETSISIARTPWDRKTAQNAKNVALVLLRRPEAFSSLRDWMNECRANGWGYYLAGVDGAWGVARVLHGEISEGIQWMEQSILRRDNEDYRVVADWYRMFLCEIYLEIISGTERPPVKVLIRNIVTLAAVLFTAETRICALVGRIRENPQFDENSHFIGRCDMILGLLYKAKKKRALALRHLSEAKRIASQFGPTPMLMKIDVALAELA